MAVEALVAESIEKELWWNLNSDEKEWCKIIAKDVESSIIEWKTKISKDEVRDLIQEARFTSLLNKIKVNDGKETDVFLEEDDVTYLSSSVIIWDEIATTLGLWTDYEFWPGTTKESIQTLSDFIKNGQLLKEEIAEIGEVLKWYSWKMFTIKNRPSIDGNEIRPNTDQSESMPLIYKKPYNNMPIKSERIILSPKSSNDQLVIVVGAPWFNDFMN